MLPEESNEQKMPEIQTDEDWKDRVKAEDAALDEKLKSEQVEKSEPEKSPEKSVAGEKPRTPPKIDPQQIPPADFNMLVSMFSTQAMVSLGLIPSPATGKSEAEPALAKHFIDLLSVVEEKTKGNLTNAEQSSLEGTLHQLRMTFLQLTRQADPSEDKTTGTQPESSSAD